MRKYALSALVFAVAMAAGHAGAEEAATLTINKDLHARLPKEIRDSGELLSVNNGSIPPWDIVSGDSVTGASAELLEALGKVLGVRIKHQTVGGQPAIMVGLNSGRYQLAFGPIGDFKSRQGANDFVDWVREYVVFAVQKGNPKGIVSLESSCGHRISVMAGGSAEKVINQQAEKCTAAGKPPIQVQSFNDQPSSILAVRSNRSDAFFASQGPITYFVEQAGGQLELSGVGKSNGFEDLYQGSVLPKGSPLTSIVKDGLQILHDNGTYGAIMKKWKVDGNMIEKVGINLGGEVQK
ncbi:polar amino acid transport system substrate-binding protein [Rhizobium aquaticum]|uniref:Polar amino acid transport system substrate-binding protein n=1 Tax=Rhizobium aquaticum TaxID=1549636 RepID=A0ABV2J7V5_9HYPH